VWRLEEHLAPLLADCRRLLDADSRFAVASARRVYRLPYFHAGISLSRRDGWQNFVLPFPDRDELARNHGPAHLTFKNRSYAYAAHFNGMGPQGVVSPPTFQPQAYVEEHRLTNGTNGLPNGHGGSQLSAAVPDFSPSHQTGEQSFNAPSEAVNGHVHAPAVNGLPNGVHTQ
jgi:la-related protein 1